MISIENKPNSDKVTQFPLFVSLLIFFLKLDFERRAKDVKDKYDLKMKKLRAEMEEARAHRIRQIEERKDAAIKDLTNKHNKKYQDIKSYYADITATNLDLIKQLKGQITDLEKQDEHDKKVLAQIEGEQKKLQDALKALNDEIKALAEEQKDYEKLQEEKERVKAEIENAEMRFRKLEFEYEVKLQQLKYLERERDSLSDKFNEAIYDIQAKTGLKVIHTPKTHSLKNFLEPYFGETSCIY